MSKQAQRQATSTWCGCGKTISGMNRDRNDPQEDHGGMMPTVDVPVLQGVLGTASYES